MPVDLKSTKTNISSFWKNLLVFVVCGLPPFRKEIVIFLVASTRCQRYRQAMQLVV